MDRLYGVFFADFFGRGGGVFLLGFLRIVVRQNMVFCVVKVVRMWCSVWLEVTTNAGWKMGQVFGIYF
jgi:hypothetical protein